jgi:predicted N-acyltransferase
VLGAAALYRKTHSYGEYIFDFGWARASMAARVPYYPKLVAAAPMTPATGTRLLLHPSLHEPGASELRARVQRAIVGATRALADELGCMSIHWLFCTRDEQVALGELGFFPRDTFQFHWRNRDYADFEAFLAGLASRKRKQIRKERREAQAALDGPIEFVPGAALEARDLAALDRFYRRTCFEHGGSDYLRPGFFPALIEHLGHRVQFARARRGGRTVAGALYLQTEHALYGRYWGCDEDIPFLHFEAAYYAGIEHAIAHRLQLFEAGAQGEHKLLRGFAPAPTYSAHWLRHPGLREAVGQFLAQERSEMAPYLEELARFTPFRRG